MSLLQVTPKNYSIYVRDTWAKTHRKDVKQHREGVINTAFDQRFYFGEWLAKEF